jgi:hypothetical protein
MTRARIAGLIGEIQAADEKCSSLIAVSSVIGICPLPFTEDPVARQLFMWEQAMETYGVPLVEGGLADQPQWFIDACDIIRNTRNAYQNKRSNAMLKDAK